MLYFTSEFTRHIEDARTALKTGNKMLSSRQKIKKKSRGFFSCSGLHSRYKRLCFGFAEIFVRIVQVDPNTFVLINSVAHLINRKYPFKTMPKCTKIVETYFSTRDRLLDALLHGAESSTTPSHLLQKLMSLIIFVQNLVLLSSTVGGPTNGNHTIKD
jgi:hypothetical protein